mmetsp:Transcript_24033/g.61938  ORF Transcript_24033/g.61938 Transcript_24033/m.61938 type:complete len:341 (+) Transcript_24033:68-1090(+)
MPGLAPYWLPLLGTVPAGLPPSPFRFERGHSDPYPYYTSGALLEPSFYANLKRDFPPVPPGVLSGANKPGAKSIRREDDAYGELLARSPAWRTLHNFVHSQSMLDLGMGLFGDALTRDRRCLVDPKQVRYFDHVEHLAHRIPERGIYPGVRGPEPTAYFLRRQHKVGDPNLMYTVMDFFHTPGNITTGQNQGRARASSESCSGCYVNGLHLDGAMRTFSILIYFSDSGQDGGDFLIARGRRVSNLTVTQRYQVHDNFGLAHLSPHPAAFHGATRFVGVDRYRQLVQIQATSAWSICRTVKVEDRNFEERFKQYTALKQQRPRPEEIDASWERPDPRLKRT